MSDVPVPEAAVTAAVQANDDFFANDDDLKFSWQDGSDVRELASRMLAAAAPFIAAQARVDERETILAEEKLFYQAVDWLLNSRHDADPAVQEAFWRIADGKYTRMLDAAVPAPEGPP